ncbi:B/F/G family RNA polymerase sigma-70 factor [Micromonospora sp. S4605]|uniref:SigB/SigF/SigG family RNA polymerase sigma factor n=1 Tax=Micromonospora sp. S4605 TaxID=1420897 RepID=UPI000D6FBD97|nr:SigB/SigF/SigG family RNA polymerase sigma factor [Micromonospora sp. S4605]PWU50400.1 B/F/G family RNA polymerase sigma-70 factor [Micromonospora sp. S4605]
MVIPTATATAASRHPPMGDPPATSEQMLRRHAALSRDDPDRTRLRTRIIEGNLPLASRLARRYSGRGEPYDDLAQVAALALVRAVDGFDARRGVKFSSYAVPTIVGALRRHFRDTTWAMRVPRRAQELNSMVRAATAELTQRQDHHPTTAELADHLDVSVNDVLAALTASQAYRLASLNAPHHKADDTETIELIGAVDPGYAGVDDHRTLLPLLAKLSPRERRILAMRFYRHMTQARIATEVGISQMQVSRLLRRALTQLRAGMSS